ncbi:MAG: DUF1579 family protein [Vicinamibacterales bacterium]
MAPTPVTRVSAAIAIVLALVLAHAAGARAQQLDLTPGFDPGPPQDMRKIAFLEGRWAVTPEFGDVRDLSRPWLATKTVTTTFRPRLGGAFLEADLAVTWPDGQVWQTTSIWSFDRFRKTFRVVYLDDLWGLLDVYEGDFVDGRLTLSNERAATLGPPGADGRRLIGRTVVRDITPGGFVIEWETSADGRTWTRAGLRWVFRRAASPEFP